MTKSSIGWRMIRKSWTRRNSNRWNCPTQKSLIPKNRWNSLTLRMNSTNCATRNWMNCNLRMKNWKMKSSVSCLMNLMKIDLKMSWKSLN